jgi:hypothetical protein
MFLSTGTGSNSFAGSLELAKGLRTTNLTGPALTIGAFTLNGALSANSNDITGVNHFNATFASVSNVFEARGTASISGAITQNTSASNSFSGSLDVTKGIRGSAITAAGLLSGTSGLTISGTSTLGTTNLSGALALGNNNITNVNTLTASTINAFSLGGNITGANNNITGLTQLTSSIASHSGAIEIGSYASISGNITTKGTLTSSNTGSNSFSGSLTVSKGLHATNAIDSLANIIAGGVFQSSSTGSNSFSGSLNLTKGLTANSYQGGGLVNCTASQKITYANGQFSCGTDLTGSAGSTSLEVGASNPDSGIKVSSISFDSNAFKVTNPTGYALVALNYGSTGPASKSFNETISGIWTFSNGASISTALELTGAASISGNITTKGTLTSSNTGSNSFSGSLNLSKSLIVSNNVTAGGFVTAGLITSSNTGSNSFSGSLDVSKGLHATNGISTNNLNLTGTGTGLNFTNGSGATIGSVGTLTINAFTLGGSIAGANNNITGLTQLTSSIASHSGAIEIGSYASISGNITTKGTLTSSNTGSNSFSGSLTVSKGLHATNGIDTSNMFLSTGPGSNSFAGSLELSKGLRTTSLTGTNLVIGAYALAGHITGNSFNLTGLNQLTGGVATISTAFEDRGTASISGAITQNTSASNSFQGSLNTALGLHATGNLTTAGLIFQTTNTGSNSFAGSLTSSKGIHATNSIDTAGTFLSTGTGSNSFAGSLELSKGLRTTSVSGTNLVIGANTLAGNVTGNSFNITGLTQLTSSIASHSGAIEVGSYASISGTVNLKGIISQTTTTSSNSFSGSLTTTKGLHATNAIDSLANIIAGGVFQSSSTGSNSFSGSLDVSKGLHATNGISANNLNLTGTGTGLNFTNGSGATIGSVGTLTINAFTLGGAVTGSNQNITGVNQLTGSIASLSGAFEVGSYASISGNITTKGTVVSSNTGSNSFSGSLDVTKGIRGNAITASGLLSGTSGLTISGATSLSGALNLNSNNITNVATLTATTINGFSLGGSLNANSNDITSISHLQSTFASVSTSFEDRGTASISGALSLTGLISQTVTTGSNSFSGSLTTTKGLHATNSIDSLANIIAGGVFQSSSTGSNSFSGSLNLTKGLTANSYQGGGLVNCTASQKITYANGQFSCGTDLTGSAGSTSLEVGASNPDSGIKVSSISFDSNAFKVTNPTGYALVALNYGSSGPASKSFNETISGIWTFSNGASISTALELTGAASISGNITTKGTLTSSNTGSNSFSGSLTVSKGLHATNGIDTAGNLSAAQFFGSGTGSNSFAGSLTSSKGIHATNSIDTAGLFLSAGTGSNSFGGSLTVSKGLHATNSIDTASMFLSTGTGSNSFAGSLELSKGLRTNALTVTGNSNFSLGAGKQLNIVATAAPTIDMVVINNSAVPIDTAGVNALAVNYSGGVASGETSAIRIDFAPGAVASQTWDIFQAIPSASARKGVQMVGLNFGGIASGGAGLDTAIKIAPGWDYAVIASGNIALGVSGTGDRRKPAALRDLKGYKFFLVDPDVGGTATGSFAIRSSNTTGSVASISATALTTGNALKIAINYSSGVTLGEFAGVLANFTPGITASQSLNAFQILPAGGAPFGVTQTGFAFSNIASGGRGTDVALRIGTGWDYGIIASANIALGATTRGNKLLSKDLKGYKFVLIDPDTGSTATGSFGIRSSNTTGSVASISATALTSGNIFNITATTSAFVGSVFKIRAKNLGNGGKIFDITVPTFASGSASNIQILKATNAAGQTVASLSNAGRFGLLGAIRSRGATSNCTGANTPAGGCLDYAETYPTMDKTIAPTDLVSIDPNNPENVMRATSHTGILGVISTNAAALINGGSFFSGADVNTGITEGQIPVALAGRVPVKISTENGPIKTGDWLTVSISKPGVGMKALRAGQVIGQAMEDYSADQDGQVVVYLEPGWYNGTALENLASFDLVSGQPGLANALLTQFMHQGVASGGMMSDINADRIAAAVELISPSIYGNALYINKIGNEGDLVSILSDQIFIGRPYFNRDTAGFALIKNGARSADVTFDREYLEQPIVNATISVEASDSISDQTIFDSNISYIVLNKTTKGFTIKLNKTAPGDIRFSWTAFAVKSAKVFNSKEINLVPPSPISTTEPTEPIIS